METEYPSPSVIVGPTGKALEPAYDTPDMGSATTIASSNGPNGASTRQAQNEDQVSTLTLLKIYYPQYTVVLADFAIGRILLVISIWTAVIILPLGLGPNSLGVVIVFVCAYALIELTIVVGKVRRAQSVIVDHTKSKVDLSVSSAQDSTSGVIRA